MRYLTEDEMRRVAGAEHSLVKINTATTDVRVVPLNDGTTSIVVTVLGHSTTWNSGVALTCQTFGLGAGLMSLAFTGGNGAAASFVASVASIGCSALVTYTGNTPRMPTDDGDEQ